MENLTIIILIKLLEMFIFVLKILENLIIKIKYVDLDGNRLYLFQSDFSNRNKNLKFFHIFFLIENFKTNNLMWSFSIIYIEIMFN